MRPLVDEPASRLKVVSIYSPTRLAILEAARARPGVSLSDVARLIGKHASTIESNVHILHKAGLVRCERDGRRVRLFLAGELSEEQLFRARLGEGAPILEAIRRGVKGRPGAIARELGITRHAACYHLKRLVRLGTLKTVQRRVLVTESRYVVSEEASA